MAREITLYPERASKDELKKFVEKRGYEKTKHLWDWSKGTLNFFWFDYDDYKSISGVELDIYPVSNEESLHTNNKWAVHVRNNYSGSFFDVKEFNEVIKQLRKRFGGIIMGDYGKNRYAPLWEDDSVPMQRGIECIYKYQKDVLKKVRHSLPDEIIQLTKSKNSKIESLNNFMKQQDPSRVIYNGLTPLLVSIVEYFLYSYFIVVLRYDLQAKQKIENLSKIKLDFSDIEKLEKGIYSKEEIVADQYNFQNLESSQKAFRDVLNLDLHNILHSKIIRKSRPRVDLFQLVSELIEDRHEIVHKLRLDLLLSKTDFIYKLDIVQCMIDTVTDKIENKYGFQINRDV